MDMKDWSVKVNDLIEELTKWIRDNELPLTLTVDELIYEVYYHMDNKYPSELHKYQIKFLKDYRNRWNDAFGL